MSGGFDCPLLKENNIFANPNIILYKGATSFNLEHFFNLCSIKLCVKFKTVSMTKLTMGIKRK